MQVARALNCENTPIETMALKIVFDVKDSHGCLLYFKQMFLFINTTCCIRGPMSEFSKRFDNSKYFKSSN